MQLLNCTGVKTLHLGQFLCWTLVFQDSNSSDLEWVPLHPKLKLDLPHVRVRIHNGLEDVVLRVLDQLYSPLDSLSGIEGADESAEGVQDDCSTSGVSGRLSRMRQRDLPVVIREIGSLLVMRIKANPPDSWTHELNQEERPVIEAENGSMAASGVLGAIVQELIGRLVGDRCRLVHIRRRCIQTLEKVIRLDEQVGISKLCRLKLIHGDLMQCCELTN